MSFLRDFIKRMEEATAEGISEGVAEGLAEGIKETIKNLPVHPIFLTVKLNNRASKALLISQRPGGTRSLEFWTAASSGGLYSASLICLLGSHVLIFVNCKQFSPLLTSFGAVAENFGDKIEKLGNTTGK